MPNDYLLLKQRALYMQQLAGQMTELTNCIIQFSIYSVTAMP